MSITRQPLDDLLLPLASSIGRIVTNLDRVPAPRGSPLHGFISGIKRPVDCLPPPGPAKQRTAAGWGWTAQQAELRTLAEAVERYSLQYQPSDPNEFTSVSSLSSEVKNLPASELLLGHPKTPNTQTTVDSRGCAAGSAPIDAALYGMLELIEAHARHCWLSGTTTSALIEMPGQGMLNRLARWLDAQGRKIRLLRLQHRFTIEIAACLMSDLDDAHLVLGTAADVSLTGAVDRAVGECFVLWRNLTSFIESPPTGDLDWLTEDEAFNLSLYQRETPPDQVWFEPMVAGISDSQDPNQGGADTEPHQRFRELQKCLDGPLFVYDMTRPEVGLPVVRVVCPSL